MSALVEVGSRRVFASPPAPGEPPDVRPPLPTWNSGGFLVGLVDDPVAVTNAVNHARAAGRDARVFLGGLP